MPVPKATENTITYLLVSELKRKGVNATPFVRVSIPGVGPREVDIWCENGGRYVIEAKFLEGEWCEALSKIYHDYLPDPSITGGFAILYPKQLSQPLPRGALEELLRKLEFKVMPVYRPEDRRRGFRPFTGTISEIASALAELILRPPEYLEPSVPEVIGALRDIANNITGALKYLAGAQLEGLFGGKEVFRNILQYEEHKYPVDDLRLAAAYVLVNQLLFYHVLSRSRPDLFPEIDTANLRAPRDLNLYFKKVLDVDYQAVFSYDVASVIPSGYLPLVKTIVSAIKVIAPEKVGGDLLGTIFHDLIPFETRKSVAAFYTNVLAAELLAWLAIDRHDAKVADLAVGSGGLLVAAYRRKRYLLERERGFTGEDHRRFVEEDLLGVDVMPFAASVAACHLALQSPEHPTDKVRIAVWDSTDLAPGKVIPSLASLKAVLRGQTTLDALWGSDSEVKGVVSLTGKPGEIPLETYDVVIMNPPFTRQERIPEEYKNVLFHRFRDYKDYLHGQLGYYGYFILLADRFLKEGGRMALVLPATVLRIRSCEGLRRLWAERYHVEYIITTWHRSAFSESARFREILLVARKGKPPQGAKTAVAFLRELPSTPGEARGMAEAIRSSAGDWEDERMVVRVCDYSRLRGDTGNWFKYVAVADPSLLGKLEELLSSGKLAPLSSVTEAQDSQGNILETDLRHFKFGSFHGFVLFDESRALRKVDLWVAERVEGGELIARNLGLGTKVRIPLSALGRGLRRQAYVRTMDVTEASDYLILSWFNGIREMAGLALSGKDLKEFSSKVVGQWRRNFEKRKANLLIARRFNLSAPGTSLLAFYSDEPIVGVDMWSIRGLTPEHAKITALWFNSTFGLLQVLTLRSETEGAWMKIHDYMFDELKVPLPEKMSPEERGLLLKLFEKWGRQDLSSILDQLKERHPARVEIDKAFLRVLELEGDADKVLQELYDQLIHEIETLGKLMKRAKAEEEE